MNNSQFSLTESSDFHCLLELMLPLYSIEEFACLPELFSIIGHEKLIKLIQYAGGETIKIPTLNQLNDSIEALDWYYKVYVTKKKFRKSVPEQYLPLVDKIKEVFDNA